MTFSVLGHDPSSGLTGGAVASCVFAIGPRCLTARAGVGVAVGQAGSEFWHPSAMLDLVAASAVPSEAVAAIAALDGAESRQVALIDTSGRVGCWTGSGCFPSAAARSSEGMTMQGNTLVAGTVEAMHAAWQAAAGQALPDRLLSTMSAGQRAGGDLRGQQSAALLVVGDEELVDLRVDHARAPLDELARLLRVDRAARALRAAVEAAQRGDRDSATALAAEGLALAPQDPQLNLWAPVLAGSREHLNPDQRRWVAEIVPRHQ